MNESNARIQHLTLDGVDYTVAAVLTGVANAMKESGEWDRDTQKAITIASLRSGGHTGFTQADLTNLPLFWVTLPLQTAALEVNGLVAEEPKPGEADAAGTVAVPEASTSDSFTDESQPLSDGPTAT